MASKINQKEILARFYDDGVSTALFEQGAVSAAFGCAGGQQVYTIWQNGEALGAKDVEKAVRLLGLAAETGCPVVTFYNSVGAKLAEGLDALTASAKLNAAVGQSLGRDPAGGRGPGRLRRHQRAGRGQRRRLHHGRGG